MKTAFKDEVNQLREEKYDLIRALEWLHDNTQAYFLSNDKASLSNGVSHALDRAWELLEEMKQTK